MLVSAHRNTIAAAMSCGVQARLSSVRSIEACLRAGRPALRPLGVDEAGRDRIHPRLRRQRARQVLGEADEAGLARAIGHAGARHVDAGDRGGVAHRAARGLAAPPPPRGCSGTDRSDWWSGSWPRIPRVRPVEVAAAGSAPGCSTVPALLARIVEPAERLDRIPHHGLGGARPSRRRRARRSPRGPARTGARPPTARADRPGKWSSATLANSPAQRPVTSPIPIRRPSPRSPAAKNRSVFSPSL